MTIPGGMMQDSVNRLRDAIQTARDAAAETRKTVAAQEVSPVTIGQEASDASSGDRQGPA